jgi:hypothetical protein
VYHAYLRWLAQRLVGKPTRSAQTSQIRVRKYRLILPPPRFPKIYAMQFSQGMKISKCWYPSATFRVCTILCRVFKQSTKVQVYRRKICQPRSTCHKYLIRKKEQSLLIWNHRTIHTHRTP